VPQSLHGTEGPIDFIFIDAGKSDYTKYFETLEPEFVKNTGVGGDNVIRSARAMKDFLDCIQTSPDDDTVIIRASMEKNDGMSISYKIR
jgi:predicted O-methyltransferase YrrM